MKDPLRKLFKRDFGIYLMLEEDITKVGNKKELQISALINQIIYRIQSINTGIFTSSKTISNLLNKYIENDYACQEICRENYKVEMKGFIQQIDQYSIEIKRYFLTIVDSFLNPAKIGFSNILAISSHRLIFDEDKKSCEELIDTIDYYNYKQKIKPNISKKLACILKSATIRVLHPLTNFRLFQDGVVYLNLDLNNPIDELIEIVKMAKKEYEENPQNFITPAKIFVPDHTEITYPEVESYLKQLYSLKDKKVPLPLKLTTILYIFDGLILGIPKDAMAQSIYEYYAYKKDIDISPSTIAKQVDTTAKQLQEIIKGYAPF